MLCEVACPLVSACETWLDASSRCPLLASSMALALCLSSTSQLQLLCLILLDVCVARTLYNTGLAFLFACPEPSDALGFNHSTGLWRFSRGTSIDCETGSNHNGRHRPKTKREHQSCRKTALEHRLIPVCEGWPGFQSAILQEKEANYELRLCNIRIVESPFVPSLLVMICVRVFLGALTGVLKYLVKRRQAHSRVIRLPGLYSAILSA